MCVPVVELDSVMLVVCGSTPSANFNGFDVIDTFSSPSNYVFTNKSTLLLYNYSLKK